MNQMELIRYYPITDSVVEIVRYDTIQYERMDTTKSNSSKVADLEFVAGKTLDKDESVAAVQYSPREPAGRYGLIRIHSQPLTRNHAKNTYHTHTRLSSASFGFNESIN